LIVMTRPIAQVGCAIASSGVTPLSSARLRPRNGPPEAVRMSRRTSDLRPARNACAKAECSESTATIWPGAAASVTNRPPMTNDSLFASASVMPAASVARVGSRPAAPVIALSTTSALS